jgi:myo-inositol-1(or 4)-monophosphatase
MLEYELELAKQAALEAGKLLRRKDLRKVECLEGKDIKLSSDKLSEKIIIDILSKSGYPILSEECGFIGNEGSEYLWIIDPLDGTANYARDFEELSCLSIALWKENEPLLGVIYRFAQDELFCGIIGAGASKNGIPIHTSDTVHLNQAILATGFPVKRDYSTNSLTGFIKQVQNFKKIRMLGTAATMGVLVAEGCFDMYMEEEIMLWDIAAASALVLAAGGIAEIDLLEHNKCICKLFANEELKGNYYADCI